MDDIGRVKVKFLLDNDPLDLDAEWMWATPQGETKFRLENSPFHAYGISYLDVFFSDIVDDVIQFREISSKSGHRTIRIRLPHGTSHKDFEALWPPLSELGCTYEGSQVDRPLYALDLSPDVDLDAVTQLLQEFEGAGLIEYEEADCF